MMMVTRLVPQLIPTIPTIPVPYHQCSDDDEDADSANGGYWWIVVSVTISRVKETKM